MSQREPGSWSVFAGVVLAITCLFSFAAVAAEPARFGVVHKVSGTVQARDPSTGNTRTLKANDVVRVGETIRSGADGEMVVRTDDSGVIAVRPKAEMAMERFSHGGAEGDRFSLNILTGAVRLITGLIGQRSKENYQVTTPTATMGVRGTDYEAYVVTAELAKSLGQREGTYNRVYKGATTLDIAGQAIEVAAGQVGLAPVAPPSKTRALFTVLLPVLLDRVPDFFVPGKFDDELTSLVPKELQSGQTTGNRVVTATTTSASGTSPAWEAQMAAFPADTDTASCAPNKVAREWLESLDGAVRRRDAKAFVALFAADAHVTARLRTGSGQVTEIELDRDELAESTMKALAALTDFTSKRPLIRARRVSPGGTCTAVELRSVVQEQGTRGGSTYKVEAVEAYSLEFREGRWLASAGSTQPR